MVAQPQTEPFITEELAELAKGLEGVIHEPRSLPQELREMPVWLKVTLNERGHWKKPCVEFRGKLSSYNWEISSHHLALDKVLKQQPEGKAGFHARDRLCVIDLDDVIDQITRQLKEPKILELLNSLKASVYLSSSGTGLHIPFRLQEGVEIDPPSMTLSFRDTEGKSGEFFGGKYRSFVAFTGVVLPRYDHLCLVEITQAEWNHIREFLWSVETVTSAEPSGPIPPATPVSAPQERAPRESEPKESPFGIEWKPKYLQTAISMFKGFIDRPNGNDDSISGYVFWWLMFYWKAAEKIDWDEAFDLSVRAEGFYLNKQPSESRREPKPLKWHEYNVNSSLRKMTNKNSMERLVFREKGEKYGKTNHEDRVLDALKYAQSKKMRGNQPVFIEIITQSLGRTRFRITDGELAKLTSLSVSSITRAKKYFRKECRNFLKIEGNTYTILE